MLLLGSSRGGGRRDFNRDSFNRRDEPRDRFRDSSERDFPPRDNYDRPPDKPSYDSGMLHFLFSKIPVIIVFFSLLNTVIKLYTFEIYFIQIVSLISIYFFQMHIESNTEAIIICFS